MDLNNGIILCFGRTVVLQNVSIGIVTLPITFNLHITPIACDEGAGRYPFGICYNTVSTIKIFGPSYQYGCNFICIGY